MQEARVRIGTFLRLTPTKNSVPRTLGLWARMRIQQINIIREVSGMNVLMLFK